jgi:hypothetical protein
LVVPAINNAFFARLIYQRGPRSGEPRCSYPVGARSRRIDRRPLPEAGLRKSCRQERANGYRDRGPPLCSFALPFSCKRQFHRMLGVDA